MTMALVNGLYKVKFNRRYHLMRIGTPSGKKMFKLDHGDWEPIEKLNGLEEALELLCQVDERTVHKDIKEPRLTISWQDSEQREFRMTVRDTWALRNILHEFPFLQEPFSYIPRKK